MSPEEREKMLQLFRANPVLTTEDTLVRQIFQLALRGVIDDHHKDLDKEERLQILSETLLEVEELMNEINQGKKTLN